MKIQTILLLLLGFITQSFSATSDTVNIIASGETHAMLEPCDCPVEPGGGLAERATLLKQIGGEKLLLDAGGFAGGGPYDNYTEGRAADSVRTIVTLRAMGAMGYDAVAIGDDDLLYGGPWLAEAADKAGVPLVSANCFLRDSTLLTNPYVVVTRNGTRFGITAITTRERLFPRNDISVIGEPIKSLRRIWPELLEVSDCQIVLAHTGEETARAVIDSFPQVAVVVNGHRKNSNFPAAEIGSSILMQFGYEGKKLSTTEITMTNGSGDLEMGPTGWLVVERGIEPDSAVAAAMMSAAEPRRKTVYDLYVMSRCPYGIAALREFLAFAREFPSIEWHLWFIGEDENGTLSSLHGPEEIDEEMTWLGVKALYPDRWEAFLAAAAAEGGSTLRALEATKIDFRKIDNWRRKTGPSELADHYRRSTRLGVTASPTLAIGNAPYDGQIERWRLTRIECSASENKPAACASLPECLDDADCRKAGHIGRCTKKETCSFTPDVRFTFTALVADSTVQHPEAAVIQTTRELFPNAAIEVVSLGSKKGRRLAKKHHPAALPFYLFEKRVAKAHNFQRIESGLVESGTGLTFKENITPSNFFPGRADEPGAVIAFVDPLFSGASRALSALMADSSISARLRVLPVILSDPAASIEEKVRREEAARWLILDSLYPGLARPYLTASLRDPGSSYWFTRLDGTGIPADSLSAQARAAGARLTAHWRELQELGIREPVTLLLGNREIVVVRNESSLSEVLETIRGSMVK